MTYRILAPLLLAAFLVLPSWVPSQQGPKVAALPQQPQKKYALGYQPPPEPVSAARHAESDAKHGAHLKVLRATFKAVGIPAEYDAVALGLVPAIKDQNGCGSCHIFDAIGVCTTAQYFAGVVPLNSNWSGSEQWMLDCLPTGGCNGGDPWSNVKMVMQKGGFPGAEDYPGSGSHPGKCKSAPLKYKIIDMGFCTPNAGANSVANTADMQACIIDKGPIAVCGSAGSWGDPGASIMRGRGGQVDHAIMCVGWKTVNGKVVWKIRNSWSTGWGDKGYCWIEEGSYSIGFEAFWVLAQKVAPVMVDVPNVVGQYMVAAKQSIQLANLTLGTTTGDTSQVVVSQLPAGGSKAAAGSAVNLAFGTTPPPPIPTGVTITLTAAQVQSVLAQAGAKVIKGEMTLQEVLDQLNKNQNGGDGGTAPKTPEASQDDARLKALEKDVADVKGAIDGLLKLLEERLPKGKAKTSLERSKSDAIHAVVFGGDDAGGADRFAGVGATPEPDRSGQAVGGLVDGGGGSPSGGHQFTEERGCCPQGRGEGTEAATRHDGCVPRLDAGRQPDAPDLHHDRLLLGPAYGHGDGRGRLR